MHSIEGFVLAGGQSRRMGTDKAALTINGRLFVERVAEELQAVTASVTIVGNSAAALQTHLPTIADFYPNWGALGGVHAALSVCTAPWALIVACDFPFVTRELFVRLADSRQDHEAVAPIQEDAIPQPLCTLYRVNPCLERAEKLIKTGERKPIALLQFVMTRWIKFSELSDLEGAAHFFDNINTPEDYSRLIRRAAR
jgi:molybdopterin-guanine dinucleotide biosynthesis protein A